MVHLHSHEFDHELSANSVWRRFCGGFGPNSWCFPTKSQKKWPFGDRHKCFVFIEKFVAFGELSQRRRCRKFVVEASTTRERQGFVSFRSFGDMLTTLYPRQHVAPCHRKKLVVKIQIWTVDDEAPRRAAPRLVLSQMSEKNSANACHEEVVERSWPNS